MNLEINTYQNTESIANSHVKKIQNYSKFSSPTIKIESNINNVRRSSSELYGIQLRTEIDLVPPLHLFDINEVLLSFK
jgi:hypothetical protein